MVAHPKTTEASSVLKTPQISIINELRLKTQSDFSKNAIALLGQYIPYTIDKQCHIFAFY